MNNFISQQEDDPMGKLFAIYSLLPLVIVIIFATAFFIRFLLMKLVSRFCWRGGWGASWIYIRKLYNGPMFDCKLPSENQEHYLLSVF